ncbi:uracil-DNA glycosylase [Pontibacillus litoralis]|uniref:Uracil-DNA glycosylase n=1 Tax=Pontibacillus litoralis JSM 072002 TaxID=1385512 RepID=A0A0A5HW86_9BACI|nr:uracil-DNA glycosylase [Pontibacillus litoralis]KGX87897.1 uracil-DNA glycosylase [Pontibacillus litoralis JSM 072002]
MFHIHNDWKEIVQPEFHKAYFKELQQTLEREYAEQTIYPAQSDILNALNATSYAETKVVLLGQDPYHGPNQAHGFSFSVQEGVPIPPSLKNMYKELQTDVGFEMPNHGHLHAWAKQGVLLLNTVLTVQEKRAHSHKGIGWERFTDYLIEQLNKRQEPMVFLLWGRPAQQKGKDIDSSKHCVLTAPHPSPLSAYRGFFGCQHFSKANDFLRAQGYTPINWQLPN